MAPVAPAAVTIATTSASRASGPNALRTTAAHRRGDAASIRRSEMLLITPTEPMPFRAAHGLASARRPALVQRFIVTANGRECHANMARQAFRPPSGQGAIARGAELPVVRPVVQPEDDSVAPAWPGRRD